MPTDPPLLQVKDLRVTFGMDEGTIRAVDGTSFTVHPGEVVGIVGESGCGKSVTMKAILQLIERPGRLASGEILFRDSKGTQTDLAKLDPRGPQMRALRGAEIALIPQEPMAAFSPVHTVGAQIIEAITLHASQEGRRVSKAEAREIVIGLFRDVGISMPEQRVDAYSWQLSGGLRQRAMIAMALSCKPRLLIADEPTTAIDVTTQAQVLALLRSIPTIHGETRTPLPVISGSLPHPFNRPTGCPFHPRCPEAMPGCATATPKLLPVAEGQSAACFLHHQEAEP